MVYNGNKQTDKLPKIKTSVLVLAERRNYILLAGFRNRNKLLPCVRVYSRVRTATKEGSREAVTCV